MRSVPVLLTCAIALVVPGGVAAAQSRFASLRGNVLADSSNLPLRGAQVSIPRLGKTASTDSLGGFLLVGIEAGQEIVMVRRIGFKSVASQLRFAAGDTLEVDILMLPTVQRLAEVQVKGKSRPAKFSDFDRRRAEGFGHFITEEQLANQQNRLLSEVVNTFPGQQIYRSNNSTAAWVASARGQQSIMGTFKLDRSDVARGAPNNQCYAAVFLDGTSVFTGRRGELLFDINSVPTAQIAGIEYYGGSSSMPPEFNVGGNTCGVLVIWTK
jgi:hypothetical protein